MTTLLESGKIFAGRYRVERQLAEGGFGAVYVAEQIATEAHVALKVLLPHVLSSSDAVDKFKQEARIAGRVQSEHIVRVVDAGLDEETAMPFLAMELLHGDDLERLVTREGPLPPDLVVEYLRQAASALDRAHGYVDRNGVPQPIVHRDLKPENLFLSRRENGQPLLKVLDFGIAKVLSSSTKVSQEVKGTPLYMAYEQAGGGPITPRTDVWALGLIAFFLLTGHSYWNATRRADSSLTQLFGEVLTLPLEPPSARIQEFGLAARLPPEFDAWFSRCVNRDPNARFASAGEAVRALAEIFGASVANPMSLAGTALLGQSASVPTQAIARTGIESRAATGQAIALSGTIREKRPNVALPVALAAGVLAVAAIVIFVVTTHAFSHASGAAARSSELVSETTLPAPSAAPEPSASPVVMPSVGPVPETSAPPSASAASSTAPKATAPRAISEPRRSSETKSKPKEPNKTGAYDDR